MGYTDKVKMREYNQAYYLAHKESELARNKLYVEKHRVRILARKSEHHKENAARELPQKRAWYAANRQKQIEYARQYAKDNPEWAKEQSRKGYVKTKQWRRDNPEAFRVLARQWFHNRRARIIANGGHFTRDNIHALLIAHRGKCYWCKRQHGPSFHVDHIWPLAKGGSNGPENLCISCPPCNRSKHAKTPMEWAGRLL